MLSFSKEAGSAFLHLEIKIGLKKKKKVIVMEQAGMVIYMVVHVC